MKINIMQQHFSEKGFTLIEIITSIVILTIIGVIAGMGIVSIVKGHVFTKKNATTAQQGQIAIARIVKELIMTDSITSGDATSITFQSKSPPAQQKILSWDSTNNTLTINPDILVDNVSSFSMAYFYYDLNGNVASQPMYSAASTAIIQISIGLKGDRKSVV